MSNTRSLRVISGGRLARPASTWGTRSKGERRAAPARVAGLLGAIGQLGRTHHTVRLDNATQRAGSSRSGSK